MNKTLLKLSALTLLAAPFGVARADLVFVGLTTIGGTGLGAVNTVLTISSTANNTSEQGCVVRVGGADETGVYTPDNNLSGAANTGGTCTVGANTDVKTGASQTQTRSFAEAGISSAADFSILYNAAEPGGNGITINALTAYFYNGSTLIYTADFDCNAQNGTSVDASAAAGCQLNIPETETGTGNTGYQFTLDAAQRNALQTAIGGTSLANIRVGLGTAAGVPIESTGGNETLFIFSNQIGTVVPEPSTTVLMATGLVGLVGFVRRRRK